jgi:hypothetical protein
VVLGHDPRHSYAINAINRVFVKLASDSLLAQHERPEWSTLVGIDEVREMGKVDCLRPLMNGGRSKGVAIALGFQDIEGMRELYGKEASEIAGQPAFKALLRMQSPETAEWAASVVGDQLVREYTTSNSSGQGVNSVTSQEHLNCRKAILPSEFMSFSPTNPVNGLSGVFCVPGVGVYRHRLRWQDIAKTLPVRDATIPDFLGRPDHEQILEPWTSAELARLGLTTPVGQGLAQPPAAPQSMARARIVGKHRTNSSHKSNP